MLLESVFLTAVRTTARAPCTRSQVSAILEVGTITDRRYHRGCRFWSDPSDLRNPLADLAGLEDRIDLPIEGPDALVDLEHEGVQA